MTPIRNGWLPFSKILQVSSNIGFTKVAEKLKKDRYFKYIDKFGFGRVTGLDLPGEVPGLLRKPETWSAVDLATHAFGQGVSTTPMQMIMAYAAIANGGILMRPYVTRKVVSPQGEVLVENQPQIVRRVDLRKDRESCCPPCCEMSPLKVAPAPRRKSTALTLPAKPARPRRPNTAVYSAKKRVSSFVGFVPADNPRLVSLVLVDEPEGNVYGGVVAAPAFRNIAQGALRQLAVAPRDGAVIPNMPAQAEPSAQRPIKRPGVQLASSTEDAVPDFLGLSMREALEKAQSMRISLKMQGSGYVVKQTPAPGDRRQEEQVVVVHLQG